jgi:rhamnosyltransferase
MKILAGMILYNPNVDRLTQSLDSIISQVSKIILYDNNSRNYDEIYNMYNKSQKVKIIRSQTNKGIAVGLNAILKFGYDNEYDWLLTLDQDSICPLNMIGIFKKYINTPGLAIVCPRVVDKRQEYKYYFENKRYEKTEQVSKCITAGSLININICVELGGFDNILFIDFVDFEYCKRVILNNYKILRVNEIFLDQELGDITYSKHYKFLMKYSKKLHSRLLMRLAVKRKFSPFRRFYVARNHIYFLRKYKNYCNVRKELIIALFSLVKLIIFCPNRIKLIIATFKGIRTGLKMKVSQYKPINTSSFEK